MYDSSLFVCLDKIKYIIYDVHDIFATSLSVKLFTITWSIPEKPYLCILTYLLNAQESRNMYFFKEWEYFHNKINFSKSSFTYYKDIVYPVCNETKLEISWLNCIFLEMAKPYDLWADTFFNKFQQQFLFHWLEIIVISHYYLSIQLSDPIKVITKCPTSNQKLVQILCLFLPTYKQMRFWKSKITLFIQKWNIVTVHRLISFVKQLENQNHASFP